MKAKNPFLVLEQLPAAVRMAVDQVAWEFEQQYGRESDPSIQTWLARLPNASPAAREALFRELLVIDVAGRRAHGRNVSRRYYRSDFPAYAAVIEEIVGRRVDEIEVRSDLPPQEYSTATYDGDSHVDNGPHENLGKTVVPVHGRSGSNAACSAVQSAVAAPEDAIRVIGPYRILKTLGQGGMGTVYLAELTEDRSKRVALKTIRGVVADASHYARFMREIESLRRLRHPHIVPYHGEGEDGGILYLAMEYIEGKNLREMTERPWEPSQAAELVETLSRAMDYVHEQAKVVHRDLKPPNVLIDLQGQPHIADFGLAKPLDDVGAEYTQGRILGTPSYMAPEQADASGPPVTAATDVYALGGILYFLLLMKPPFQAPTFERILMQVRSAEPAAPRSMDPDVPEQLERICLKCLEKKPENRYASAHDLAEELRRFRTGERLLTRPLSWSRRFLRLVRRHRKTASLIGFAFSLLLITLVTVSWGLVAVSHERDRTETEKNRTKEELKKTERANYRNILQKVELSRQQGIPLDPGNVPERQAGWETDWLRQEATLLPQIRLSFSGHDWPILQAAVSPDGKRVVTCGADGQLLLFDLNTGRQLRRLDAAQPVQISRDRISERYLHHAEALVFAEELKFQNVYYSAATWLGKSSRIATVTFSGSAQVIDTETGDVRDLFEDKTEFHAVAANAEGNRILLGGQDGAVLLSIPRSAATPQTLKSGSAVSVVLRGPHDRGWILARDDGRIDLLDDDLREQSHVDVPGPVWSLDLARDGEEFLLAAGVERPLVLLFSLSSEEGTLKWRDAIPLPQGSENVQGVRAVRLDPSRNRLLTIDDTGRMLSIDHRTRRAEWGIRAYNGWSGHLQMLGLFPEKLKRSVPFPLRRRVGALALIPGTSDWLTSGQETALNRWSIEGQNGKIHLMADPEPRLGYSSGNDSILWVAGQAGMLRAFNTRRGQQRASHKAHTGGVQDLAVLRNAEQVATVGNDKFLRIWKLEQDKIVKVQEIAHDTPLRTLAISPDEKLAAAVDVGGKLNIWNLKSRVRVQRHSLGNGKEILTGRLAFDPSGKRLAVFGVGQGSQILDVGTLEPAVDLPRMEVAGKGGTALAWVPAESNQPERLFFADDTQRTVLWDVRSGVKVANGLSSDPATVLDYAFCPNGPRLFAIDRDRLRVIEVDEWELNLTRRFEKPGAERLAVDAPGHEVAIGFADGRIEVWQHQTTLQNSVEPLPEDPIEWREELSASLDLVGVQSPLLTDADGHVAFLAVDETRPPAQFGQLFYVTENAGRLIPESIDPTVLVHKQGVTLTFSPSGNAAVVYRAMRAGPQYGTYDGELRIAIREAPNRWVVDADPQGKPRVVSEGNVGFWPAPLWKDGRIDEVLHFNFTGYSLLRSIRTAAATWQSEAVGHWGDGYTLRAFSRDKEPVHLLFHVNRYNKLDPNLVHAQWEGRFLSRSPIDPSLAIGSSISFTSAPDGRPVIFGTRPSLTGTREWLVGELDDANKWRFEPIPGRYPQSASINSVVVTKSGERWVLFSRLNSDNNRRQLATLHQKGGVWRVRTVMKLQDQVVEPTLVADRNGRVTIVLQNATPKTVPMTILRPVSSHP